jgi:U3 small nucleolar RNA-associated protein 18
MPKSEIASRKRQRQPEKRPGPAPSTEELRLEALLFGGAGATGGAGGAIAARGRRADAGATTTAGAAADDDGGAGGSAAWHDEDDERLRVNIAGTARLRKLRTTQEERVVSGPEYAARLRAHFAAQQQGGAGAGAAAPSTASWAELPADRRKKRQQEKRQRRAAADAAARASRGDDEEEEDEDAGRFGRASDDDDDEQDDDDEDNEEEEAALLLRDTAPLLLKRAGGRGAGGGAASGPLPPHTLSLSRLRDANLADPSRSVVQASAFHPEGRVLLVGSLDHRVRFFSVDGAKNSRLASLFLPDLPVSAAAWTGDGAEVICTGRRPFYYVYDVNAGKAHRIPGILGREERSLESVVVSPGNPASDATAHLAFLGAGGTTVLCSARTKAWVGNVKMEGSVRAAAFSRGPTGGGGGAGPLSFPELVTVGGGGDVYRWDLRTLKCISRHADEGSTGCTSVAVSPDGRRYAVGSGKGVVNVYDAAAAGGGRDAGAAAAAAADDGDDQALLRAFRGARPEVAPIKTVLNLTTSVDTLQYSPDGSVLLMASQKQKDALKLLHTPSNTVFANWPTSKTPLHYVTATAFSPQGGFLTIGNDRGRVLLYRLHHFPA